MSHNWTLIVIIGAVVFTVLLGFSLATVVKVGSWGSTQPSWSWTSPRVGIDGRIHLLPSLTPGWKL